MIKYGVINDDATELKLTPYFVRKSKIFSILIHIVVSEYVYIAFGYSNISFIAALLFSIHPLTIQVSAWRAGRHYGFNALVFLLVLALAPFSFFIYFFSILGIGTNLFTPLCFIFTKHWYVSFMFLILCFLSYKSLRQHINAKIKGEGWLMSPIPEDFKLYKFEWNKIIIAIKTFGYYSLACLLPIKNGFYNSFLATLGSSDKETKYWYSLNRHFWGGILAILLMSTIWCFNINNFIGMGIMLFVLSIIPFLNFITIQQFTAPRYAYLPLIGFQVALVGLLMQLGVAGYCILSALWLFYFDRMIKVRKIYSKNDITMIELDSQVFPDNPRLWYYRYEYMLHKNNSLMAFAEASYGLKHLPEDCQLWFGLACASFDLGDMNAATQFINKSEKFMILAERKNMQGLIAEMRQRIKLYLENKWKKGRLN